jgi:crossover junction endodeoxyribonuclease RuvC
VIKQTVTGRGAASKDQIGFFVKAVLKLKRPPAADAADALAIALTHARLAGSPLRERPRQLARGQG